MSNRNPQALTYKLLVRKEASNSFSVGPALDFERTAKTLAGLYLEGFETGDVRLKVGLLGKRDANAQEQAAVLKRALEVIQATHAPS